MLLLILAAALQVKGDQDKFPPQKMSWQDTKSYWTSTYTKGLSKSTTERYPRMLYDMVDTYNAGDSYVYIPSTSREQCLKVYKSSKYDVKECKLPPYCGHVVANTQDNGWFSKLLVCYGTGEEVVSYYADDNKSILVAPRDWFEEYTFKLLPGCTLSDEAAFWTVYANGHGIAIVRPNYIMGNVIRYHKKNNTYVAPTPVKSGDGKYCLERTEHSSQYISFVGKGDTPREAMIDALHHIPLYGYCSTPGKDPGRIGQGYRISVDEVRIVKRFHSNVNGGVITAVINNLMVNARICRAYMQTGGLFTGVVVHLFEGIGHLILVSIEQIFHWLAQLAEWLLHRIWMWIVDNHSDAYVMCYTALFLTTLIYFNNWTTALILTSVAATVRILCQFRHRLYDDGY